MTRITPHIFERSYGVIPFRHTPEGWQVLLVKHIVGHWGFPKGHGEAGEVARQSALRELREETGMKDCKLLDTKEIISRFTFHRDGTWRAKRVSYFVGTTEGTETLTPQHEEIAELCWFFIPEAHSRLPQRNTRHVLEKAYGVLQRQARL